MTRLVEVTWTDHQFHFGEYGGDGLVEVVSCGFFVAENDKTIAVALSRTSAGRFAETQVIDKRTLLKRRWIKER